MPTFSNCSSRIVRVRRKVPAEAARDHHAHRREQHHRAVGPRRGRVELLHVVPHPAEEEGEPERQQQVRQNRADQRGAHHIEQTGPQGHQPDDQLRRVPERRVQQPADRVAGRVAICSVACTISPAIGINARAAQKNNTGGDACEYFPRRA